MNTEVQREEVLKGLGATAAEIQELIAYGAATYDWNNLPSLNFPWPDEPYVRVWEAYAKECQCAGSIAPMSKYLVQMQFPIAQGMSQNEDYRAATKRAVETAGLAAATGLRLQAPERSRVLIHPTPAGRIPILVADERKDFVALVQALTERNEPSAVPDSMGACMVSGYNNLHRIRLLREAWERENPRAAEAGEWSEEFNRIIGRPELFRDRFILVSEGPYSNASAREMGLSEDEWRKISLAIRIDHECTHYFVRRAFPGSRFQKNMHEEVVADYAGISAACGAFRAGWFLRFIGLENFPQYRRGGRLENYRGQTPLGDGAFVVLQRLMKQTAENIERFSHERSGRADAARARPFEVLALSSLSIEELASPEGPGRIAVRVREFELLQDSKNSTPAAAHAVRPAREEK
jgi:Family of unknown function (DUF7005)